MTVLYARAYAEVVFSFVLYTIIYMFDVFKDFM